MLKRGGAYIFRQLRERRGVRWLFPVIVGLVGMFMLLHTSAAAPGFNGWLEDRYNFLQPITIQIPPEEKPLPPRPETVNPLMGTQLYVNPKHPARAQADQWRASRPADAAQMDKIANVPTAIWFGDWHADVQMEVQKVMSAAAWQTPVLVAYNFPQRDCGSFSSGGVSSAEAYKAWIRAFAAGIGTRPAIVILEPDGLGLTRCLTPEQTKVRYELFRYAVTTIKLQPRAKVYLDAGNAHWLPAEEAATRLQQAGIASADGFALNISNFATTADSTDYGQKIAPVVGKGFVIDTSRNGLGPTPDHEWCNPSGRALGDRSAIVAHKPWIHAYLWIKVPGESDGSCNGGPPAGTWWPEYALGLAQRAQLP